MDIKHIIEEIRSNMTFNKPVLEIADDISDNGLSEPLVQLDNKRRNEVKERRMISLAEQKIAVQQRLLIKDNRQENRRKISEVSE